MPDHRSHRGAHPEDRRLFDASQAPRLRAAVNDFSWLLTRGYATPSGIKIVGDRYELDVRQRMAVLRSSCSDEARDIRTSRRVEAHQLVNQKLYIDGYNVLTTLETALGGGVVLIGRDGAMRDVAGVHGTWRRIEETRPAITLVGELLADLRVAEALWLLDSPVSNSGRFRQTLLEVSNERKWKWDVNVVVNPDAELIACNEIVASADSVILDGCKRWFSLAFEVVRRKIPQTWMMDLSQASS